MPRKPAGPIPDPHESHPLDKYPYAEIHDWEFHQPTTGREWHRVFNSCLLNSKYRNLTAAERGLLHGLWAYRGGTGCAPPRHPERVASALGLPRNRYVTAHMKTLERMGFLIPRVHQKRREKSRREEKRTEGQVGGVKYSAEFAEFWAAYPRKVGKGAAWKAWKQRKDRPKNSDMLTSVEAHKSSEQWTKDGGRYIPYPATFLNQSRWEDEPDAADREVWI